jgi:hypothetical protein
MKRLPTPAEKWGLQYFPIQRLTPVTHVHFLLVNGLETSRFTVVDSPKYFQYARTRLPAAIVQIGLVSKACQSAAEDTSLAAILLRPQISCRIIVFM